MVTAAATHKGRLDANLDVMQDVRMIDVEQSFTDGVQFDGSKIT